MLFLFHTFVLTVNYFTLWYDYMYMELPLPEELKDLPYKARGIFLTFWCLILQTIYFTIALLNDIIGSNAASPKHSPIIRRIKDIVFSLAFPVALYVALVFWSLYAIHKDLIFPENVEKLFPAWVNHTMHTTIVPFIILELLLSNRNYPSRKVGMPVALLFNFAYISWIHYIYFYKGVWVYPFLEIFNWPMRIIFCGFSTFIGLIVYSLGEKLNTLVSPSTRLYTNGVERKGK
ncbi:hypothetical protein K1T71_002322 [Dendrolimus kikuchii]|uniref:Uncharacterized protein n=1 Tax=Dendrolimus kikuchii TaxID=765133 RepID=A0ACC1DCR1_9NEOP|nr:hypothetical protein K1T71_002322 [Dendrolimus kikuchii]